MNRLTRLSPFALFALAVLLSTAGCKSNQNTADSSQAGGQDLSSDPASANLAPVSTNGGPSSDSSAQGADQNAQPQTDAGAYNQADQSGDDSSYGEEPAETADAPPPPLPDYQQPPAPGDDYLWTPGYWDYASAGYYWVPGVWVQAPYQGALWTPGYWGWHHNRYAFFRGYWGRHIGYYGGVNYGFGYTGVGYQGGYWNGGNFFFNRAVNNINVNVVHNVYSYRVNVNSNVRVSFNGGQGGIQVRPRPAELAALREPHAAPMHAQLENEHVASTNRAQFASVNQGRPASVVVERPLAADRDVHPVAPPPARVQPTAQQHGVAEPRPNAAPVHPNEPVRNTEARPAPQPEVAPHPAPHAGAPQPQPQERPAAHAAPVEPAPHAAPARPAPRPEVVPHPAPHAEAPQPQPQERPAPHSEPAKPALHAPPPAPAQHTPPAKPAPHAEPAKPAPHPAPAKPAPPKREDQHPQ